MSIIVILSAICEYRYPHPTRRPKECGVTPSDFVSIRIHGAGSRSPLKEGPQAEAVYTEVVTINSPDDLDLFKRSYFRWKDPSWKHPISATSVCEDGSEQRISISSEKGSFRIDGQEGHYSIRQSDLGRFSALIGSSVRNPP